MKEFQRICVHNDPYVLPFFELIVLSVVGVRSSKLKMQTFMRLLFLKQGKVEAELELLTQEEAEKKPAGRAREDPQALEKPK